MPAIQWYAYNFPNRRSEKTVVEVTLTFRPGEKVDQHQLSLLLKHVLQTHQLLDETEPFPAVDLPADDQGAYASLLMQTTLLLQQSVGHAVSDFAIIDNDKPDRVIAVVEHQHGDVGLTAVKLAVELINGKRRQLSGVFEAFAKFARERLLPKDTQAVIEAARRCDIPVLLLERQPFKRGDFADLTKGHCIRRNGLVMLGHGRFQHVIDGMFCLDASAKLIDTLYDPELRRRCLQKLDIKLEEAGKAALDEHHFQCVVVNGQVTALIDESDSSWHKPDMLDSDLIEQVLAINCDVGFAPIAVSIRSKVKSPGIRLADCSISDFNLAPDLDHHLQQQDDVARQLMRNTADLLIDWLFHGKSQSRLPVVAITGTNGKTTTTRLVNHIFNTMGKTTGMVCTDGTYVGGEQVLADDHGTVSGHFKVLNNPSTDVAVLETHHAGILKNGFAFSWCDVAVCLNVSEDHLGHANIESVEQMARVKQALVERGRYVVLNADNEHTAGMIDSTRAQLTCLVSMEQSADQLRARFTDASDCLAVLESIDGETWIVIHDHQHRLPLMPVNSIPLTFAGTAAFNISNAMHAALATYVMDTPVSTISNALAIFKPGYEQIPGRLNEFEGLPYRVIMDFAHNPDGHRQLCEFVDAQQVSGRKILAFSGSVRRIDETIINMGRAVAGHFDFYFCKDYPSKHEKRRYVAHLLKQGLLEKGVKEEQIASRSDDIQVTEEILDFCRPGDLLVFLVGYVEKSEVPRYINRRVEKLALGQ